MRDPRVAFEHIWIRRDRRSRAARRDTRRSIDWIGGEVERVRRQVGSGDRRNPYLDNVREIEQHMQAVERRRTAAARSASCRRKRPPAC